MSKTLERVRLEKHTLTCLQSISMQGLALQQYVEDISKFPREVEALGNIDADLESLLNWVRSREDEEKEEGE